MYNEPANNTTSGPSVFIKNPDIKNQGLLWSFGIMCWECGLGWWNKKSPCGWKTEASTEVRFWPQQLTPLSDSGSQGEHWSAVEGTAQLTDRRSGPSFQFHTISWAAQNSTKAVNWLLTICLSFLNVLPDSTWKWQLNYTSVMLDLPYLSPSIHSLLPHS